MYKEENVLSDYLEKARVYEMDAEQMIKAEDRPFFHLSPRSGWMNDPNGFSMYKGKIHQFYQYYPYKTQWGPMHWGHAVSEDFVKWDYLPAAMAPDETYDNFGCFSGSAIEMQDGRQMLVYTAVREEEKDGEEIIRQTQCLAFGDGVDYEKYSSNPVIDAKSLPEGWSPVDFRDPKIFRFEDDDHYSLVVGGRSDDGSGSILLYESMDGIKWDFVTVLDRCRKEYGSMWECPDFFELDGKYLILT
jgi:beta-fructofuranosidase